MPSGKILGSSGCAKGKSRIFAASECMPRGCVKSGQLSEKWAIECTKKDVYEDEWRGHGYFLQRDSRSWGIMQVLVSWTRYWDFHI